MFPARYLFENSSLTNFHPLRSPTPISHIPMSPGAPMILGGSDSSRPTSAITGSSSQSNKAGPKIHLKHVLRNILATSNGVHHENLLDRYVQQQSEY